jgi:hypothetical protein
MTANDGLAGGTRRLGEAGRSEVRGDQRFNIEDAEKKHEGTESTEAKSAPFRKGKDGAPGNSDSKANSTILRLGGFV